MLHLACASCHSSSPSSSPSRFSSERYGSLVDPGSAPLPASGADPGSTSEPYRSEENRDGEEEGEEEWQEAQAKCSIHEADEPERNARCGGRLRLNEIGRASCRERG